MNSGKNPKERYIRKKEMKKKTQTKRVHKSVGANRNSIDVTE